jgi:hypothetical protein
MKRQHSNTCTSRRKGVASTVSCEHLMLSTSNRRSSMLAVTNDVPACNKWVGRQPGGEALPLDGDKEDSREHW